MKIAVRIGLLILLCSVGWAQSAVPGTFSAPNTQSSVVIAGPLLTPPSVSFGSGLTSQGQTIMMSTPQGSPGYVSPVNGYVPMPRPAVIAVAEPANAVVPGSPSRFDFIVAPSGFGNLGEVNGSGVGDTNLGQIAASLRKGPPPTQRTFTNEDISRMNGVSGNNYQMPGASTTQPQYPQQQRQQKPQTQQPQTQQPHSGIRAVPLPPGAKPSPFSPRPGTEGTQQTASDQ